MSRDLDVVIPSRDSPIIGRVVAAVLAQAGFEHVREVLIVGRDQAGLLAAEPALAGSGRWRLLDTGQPVSEPAARNLGLARSTAPLVLFLDSDCLPQPGWLLGHLGAHAPGAPERLVCGGVLADGEGYWSLVYNLSLFYGFLDCAAAGGRTALPTLNLSFPRSLAERVGPFDEGLLRATDVDWSLRARRAGFGLEFRPGPLVQHRHARRSLGAVWQDCAGSGRHSRQVRLRHAGLVAAPALLRSQLMLRLLAPLLAVWVTARVALFWPGTFRGRWRALPGFWLTKLAWAWGAGAR